MMKHFCKIKNYEWTINGDCSIYRKNNVSKQNFYRKFGRDYREWDKKEINALIWEYKGDAKGTFLDACILYNAEINTYIITNKSNIDSWNAYTLNYKQDAKTI